MAVRQGQPALKLTVSEVLVSVKSLYADELKPFGRVLLKRLRERAARAAALARGLAVDMVDPESMPKIDPKRLRKVCQMCPQLRVESEEGREFSVFLIGQPCTFLDVCSPNDTYPAQMWQEAAAYFRDLSMEEMYLPGGRYACARELVRRGVPFLVGCSLGQVCHIIQLAISQKRLLGYVEGQLVPYQHSEEWIKEQCAFHQQPICHNKLGAEALPVASWAEARERLWELLNTECNPEPGVLTLSNVKRLFRSRFELELSETALGHARLFDLLRDVRFRDVCVLQAHKNGQLLVKRAEGPQQLACQLPVQMPDMWSAVYMGSVSYPSVPMHMGAAPSLSMLRQVELDLGMEGRWNGLSTGVALPCSKGQDEVSSQSTEVPVLRDVLSSSGDEGEGPVPPSPLEAQAKAIRAEEEENIASFFAESDAMEQEELELEDSDVSIVKNTFIQFPSPKSSGARRRLRSVPRDMIFRRHA